jgi:SAM-dependent methyltransferase
LSGEGSALIDKLVREHWDNGPFAKIKDWVSEAAKTKRFGRVLEAGCGVGGLHAVLKPYCDFYLGADSSFASIALARHLALGVPYPGALRVPEDLLRGSVSREIKLPVPESFDGRTDFIVTDFQNPAVVKGWDLTLSLNMIDMLNEPDELPRLQAQLLKPGGMIIQSCPYIWHASVANGLREKLPENLHGNSARAVEWLYREAGFEIGNTIDQQPWLFFKHVRQLEIYSVHMFSARLR